MTNPTWPDADFAELTTTEELVLVVSRAGREPIRVPVWVVAADGDIYVRSYKGVTSVWFRRVEANPDQSIHLQSGDTPVRFENVDRHARINRAIDAEYNRKYARFDYTSAMSEPAALEATLRLLPR